MGNGFIPTMARRKLVKMGGSVYVAIPKEWLEKFKLDEGDEVFVASADCVKIHTLKQAAEQYGDALSNVKEE